MDISGGINRTVNFYTANTGSNLNLAAAGENKIYGSNMFSSEFAPKETVKKTSEKISAPHKRRKKNKRLNTLDTDFLPDAAPVEPAEEISEENFFTEKKGKTAIEKIKQAAGYLFESAPLINYFYLRRKEKKLQNAAEKLNDIILNTGELLTSAVPFGEDGSFYNNIAQNLNDAAKVIGSYEKEF